MRLSFYYIHVNTRTQLHTPHLHKPLTHACTCTRTHTHTSPPHTYAHTHWHIRACLLTHVHTHTLFFSVPLLRPFLAGPPWQTHSRAAHLSQGPPYSESRANSLFLKARAKWLRKYPQCMVSSLQSCYWSLNLLYRPMLTKEQNPILCYNYQPISFFIILF